MKPAEPLASRRIEKPKLQYVQSIQAITTVFKDSLKAYLDQNKAIVIKETKEGLDLYEIVI